MSSNVFWKCSSCGASIPMESFNCPHCEPQPVVLGGGRSTGMGARLVRAFRSFARGYRKGVAGAHPKQETIGSPEASRARSFAQTILTFAAAFFVLFLSRNLFLRLIPNEIAAIGISTIAAIVAWRWMCRLSEKTGPASQLAPAAESEIAIANSRTPESPIAAAPELQFERADYSEGAATPCSSCKQAIQNCYFEINGKIVCSECRNQTEAAMTQGSRVGRFSRAALFGLVAGAAGAFLYFAILALTGYELGLIAIVVGLLVGFAVRAGGRGRGGWAYQALAMFLTYASIVSGYAPMFYGELKKGLPPEALEAVQSSTGFLHIVIAITLYIGALVFSFLAPFLSGVQNLIGLLIIGIGLYQAWKINKRTRITGPFAVRGTKSDAASAS